MALLPSIKKRLSHIDLSRSNLLSKNKIAFYLFFLIITAIFFINGLHESYPDEFDNIMGGWYSLHGHLIYKDWFTHHGPIAYWIAAIVEIFSGQSFFRFRIIYSILLVLYIFGTYLYLKKSLGFERTKFYLAFIGIVSVAATYFWAHMLLADSLSGFLLVPVFGLIILKTYYKKSLSIKDLVFISVLCFLSILSSLTFTYLIAGIYFTSLFLYFFFPEKKEIFKLKSFLPFIILIFPFLCFLLYLVLTGSFAYYIKDAVVFNQKFYIYNYPRPEGQTFINPIRFAILIAQEFQNNFSTLLVQARNFEFTYPFNITLAIINTSLVIYLILKRRFALALFVVFCLIYSNGRSNPLTSRETDYQSAVYIMFSFFNMTFLIYAMYEELKKDLEYPKKLIMSALFILVLIYSFFCTTFLVRKFSYKAYDKYMGKSPTIYDRPKIAPIINSMVSKDEYALIGPFEFEELFYMNAKLPTKYQILIPGMGKSPEIQQEMISDLQKNKPKVIYFDRKFFILGSNPEMHGKFFLDYLDNNYVKLMDYDDGDNTYHSKIPIDGKLDLDARLYLDKDRAAEIIKELLEKNIIEAN